MSPGIAINARFQNRHITGVERYAHEISKRIHPRPRFISPSRRTGQVGGHVWEQLTLPTQTRPGEVLWSPANAGPWVARKHAVTMHDASIFDHPEWFKPAFAAWTRLSWKVLARRAEAIITVSNFSRERLVRHLRIAPEKIQVILNGVGKPFEPQSQNHIEFVKQKHKINKPYFLFVGTIEPRKNLNLLLSAWQHAKLDSHDLILSGSEGRVFKSAQKSSQPIGLSSNLVHVPDEDLPALYAGATAFVSPSLYEGFGLTALEAMACGAPVIATRIPAYAEIMGDSALLIDPHEPRELAEAMKTIASDRSLAESLRERGFQRAAELTWDESARKTQALLESLQ